MSNILIFNRVRTVITSESFSSKSFWLVALVGDIVWLVERSNCGVLVHLGIILIDFQRMIGSTCPLAFVSGLHSGLIDWWNLHFIVLLVVIRVQKVRKITTSMLLLLTQHGRSYWRTLSQSTHRSHTSFVSSIRIREDTSRPRRWISGTWHVPLYL